MSEDFLKNPLSLFDVQGKTAIVTGASGAFGALAAKVLAGAGANVVLCSRQCRRTEKSRRRMQGARRQGRDRRQAAEFGNELRRPSSKRRSIASAVSTSWWSPPARTRWPRSSISRPSDFLDIMDANVTQSWLMARAAGRQMLKQGNGGKVILMSSARGLLGHPAGYTAYCASKSAVDGITKALGCEWGDDRHHRQCARPDRLPLAADRMDVRRHRARQDHVRKGFLDARAEGPPRRAVRPRRAASVPRLEGVRLLHRPHPLRRRRLYGGLSAWPRKRASLSSAPASWATASRRCSRSPAMT